ncbi:uncharacterized protein VTP21DRAFT_10725 [Calcarisporiella thermophila]|uniref:uncharacterized protein n=1 Tax=Calcarisporiella thermophila TaxID=911321 RepID=UPI0037427A76
MNTNGPSLGKWPVLSIKDPSRFSISQILVSNKTSNAYLCLSLSNGHIAAVPKCSDMLEFVVDPSTLQPMLKLTRDDALGFHFKFHVERARLGELFFVCALTAEDMGRALEGDLETLKRKALLAMVYVDGISNGALEWSWKWDVHAESRRNHCAFVQHLPGAGRYEVLASFDVWFTNPPVSETCDASSLNTNGSPSSPYDSSPLSNASPHSISMGPSQSSPNHLPCHRLSSPPDLSIIPSSFPGATAAPPSNTGPSRSLSVSAAAPRHLERGREHDADQQEPEDGPLFRATLNQLEKKTATLRQQLKRVLKGADAFLAQGLAYREAEDAFLQALHGLPAAEPIMAAYLSDSFRALQEYRTNRLEQMQALLIDPLRNMYDKEVKTVETRKREFDEESREYYASLAKYLAIKNDKANLKKHAGSEARYQARRAKFELHRLRYYHFLQELENGRGEQEIRFHLLNYAEKHHQFYQQAALELQQLKQALDATRLQNKCEAQAAQQVSRDREERRRALEKQIAVVDYSKGISSESYPNYTGESPAAGGTGTPAGGLVAATAGEPLDSPRSNALAPTAPTPSGHASHDATSDTPSNTLSEGRLSRDPESMGFLRKKEGFLFATSRPNHHTSSFGASAAKPSQQTWHKYWCVVSGGQLQEYSNWKRQPETHNEPINLRFATVREARNAERRFCFEVITPHYKRTYQAVSDEDMQAWIQTISNAIESLLNGTCVSNLDLTKDTTSHDGDVNAAHAISGLTRPRSQHFTKRLSRQSNKLPELPSEGKDLSRPSIESKASFMKPIPKTHATVAAAAPAADTSGAMQLVQRLWKKPGNSVCADCGTVGPKWCSVNLGILLCIECSGIHRSLGTHLSKVRSLTLDTYQPELYEFLNELGNERSNEIWEALLRPAPPLEKIGLGIRTPSPAAWSPATPRTKPTPDTLQDKKRQFILAKYVEREYALPNPDANRQLSEALAALDPVEAMRAVASGAVPRTEDLLATGVVTADANGDEVLANGFMIPLQIAMARYREQSTSSVPPLGAASATLPGEAPPPLPPKDFESKESLLYFASTTKSTSSGEGS